MPNQAWGAVPGWALAVSMILSVAFWILLVAGLVGGVHLLSGSRRPGRRRNLDEGGYGGYGQDGRYRYGGGAYGPQREDPERRLARRFANGDIDEEEFLHRLEVLRRERNYVPIAGGAPWVPGSWVPAPGAATNEVWQPGSAPPPGGPADSATQGWQPAQEWPPSPQRQPSPEWQPGAPGGPRSPETW